MIRKKAPTIMNYKLNTNDNQEGGKGTLKKALTRLVPLMKDEKKNVVVSLIATLVSSASALVAPIILAHVVDTYIVHKDFHGVLVFSSYLFLIYIASVIAQYVQTITMGGVGRRVLYNLRNAVFVKLQELPVAFFNQNKAGDLISRINNDTDKLNQFFAQALNQFLSNGMLIIGAGIFLVSLNIKLGAAALVPALGVLIVTQLISGWVQKKNLSSLQTLGGLSAEIQESLNNFKVIVAFNRLDYFREKFKSANEANYNSSISAGVANNIFIPIYGLAANLAQLIVLAYGIVLIEGGHMTIGLLIGFTLYVTNFYNPLRQLASVWSSLQLALAALDRISEVLGMESDMKVTVPDAVAANNASGATTSDAILEFKNVGFRYFDSGDILKNINLTLEKGKTYALVGPTGGGKTTTASLMARLYDPTEGAIFLDGRDIRTYSPAARAKKIGFILQEPFLFTGTVRENILYANEDYKEHSKEALMKVIEDAYLTDLLKRFDEGLDTKVASSGDGISLGQKQLIAFMRASLRNPELLILDEATANIDTVTEELLEDILRKLPPTTTKVIIAHRLNTIANADDIFFVNGGKVTEAGSMEHAMEMIMKGERKS